MLTESSMRGEDGVFTAVAGLGTTPRARTSTWPTKLSSDTLSQNPACAALVAGPENATFFSWSNRSLPLCAPALDALSSVIASARSLGSSASMFVTVFAATHILLVAAADTLLPANLRASLGGVPCIVNWIAPDGAIASITTPTFRDLCAALGASNNATDCGTAQLVLVGDLWSTTSATILSVAGGASGSSLTLSLPVSYAPALVGADYAGFLRNATADALYRSTGALPSNSPFGELASIASGDTDSLLAAAALVPSARGFRVMAECQGYTRPSLCAAAIELSYEPPTSLKCSWGSGDTCSKCPDGALCPGGSVLLARPGWWTPLAETSLPTDLQPCPQPDATLRCPGWRDVVFLGKSSALGCGAGYRGVSCAACAANFFPKSGVCVQCPDLGASKVIAAVSTILVFIGGLVGAGIFLSLFAWRIGAPWSAAVFSAGALSAWFFVAAQSSAAAFSVTQSVAPPQLESWYVVLTSLLFKGISLPPACFQSIPYIDAWIAIILSLLLVLVAVSAATYLACTRENVAVDAVQEKAIADADATATNADARKCVALPAQLLYLAANLLLLGHGPFTAAFANTLTCSSLKSQPVRVYLSLNNDLTTLATALANPTSPVSRELAASRAPAATVADFVRAVNDPVFASSRLLKSALDAPMQFSLVLADGFSVCYEGPHARAWSASAAVGALVVIGFPLVGIWATSAYRCVCVRTTGARDFAQKFHATLAAALGHPNIHPQVATFPFLYLILSAVLVGTASLAARTTDTKEFVGLMSLGIGAPLIFAAGTLRYSPHQGIDAWQNWGTVFLLLLSSVSSACSVFLWYARESGSASGAAWVPLIFAIPVPIGIFIAWWRALAREHLVAKLLVATAAENKDDIDRIQVDNPLHVVQEKPLDAPPPAVDDSPADDAVEVVDNAGSPEVNLPASNVDDDNTSDGDDDVPVDEPFDWSSRARAPIPVPPSVSRREGITPHVVGFLSSDSVHSAIATARQPAKVIELPQQRAQSPATVNKRKPAAVTSHVADFLSSAKLQHSLTHAAATVAALDSQQPRALESAAPRRSRWEMGSASDGDGVSFHRPEHAAHYT